MGGGGKSRRSPPPPLEYIKKYLRGEGLCLHVCGGHFFPYGGGGFGGLPPLQKSTVCIIITVCMQAPMSP